MWISTHIKTIFSKSPTHTHTQSHGSQAILIINQGKHGSTRNLCKQVGYACSSHHNEKQRVSTFSKQCLIGIQIIDGHEPDGSSRSSSSSGRPGSPLRSPGCPERQSAPPCRYLVIIMYKDRDRCKNKQNYTNKIQLTTRHTLMGRSRL